MGYITLSKTSAKRIIWPELKRQNQTFNLGGRPNNTDLSFSFRNESNLYIFGAHHREEIEKIRGIAFDLVYIDECQSFRPYLKELVEDVLEAALFDYGGQLRMIGTPGPVPVGYFYDVSRSEGVSHHHWTIFDNPHIRKKSGKDPMERLKQVLKRRGVGVNHPSIRREFFGEWVADPDALVFKYDGLKNHYVDLPKFTKPWEYVMGVDLGFDDADAIAVIGWNPESPKAYLIEEEITPKQGISELFNKLEVLIAKYDPHSICMDSGGLGKKIAKEMQKRTSIPVKAAEKSRKFEYIEILNDALRSGRLLAKKESAFAADTALVEWNRDHIDKDKMNDKLRVSDRYHSDICDAVLYGFREAMHWLYTPPAAKKPKRGTEEDLSQQEKEMMEQAERQALGSDDDNFEQGGGWDDGLEDVA